ncbi:MAG: septum formation initiator family protein [Bacteroidales bacterium]|nr:septum formation initiator family protein [Bacteroidales bacterium]
MLERLKNTSVYKWRKPIVYIGSTVVFLAYFCFSDNGIREHLRLNRKINNLEESILQTKNQINNKYTYDELKSNDKLLEQYAREQLNMQKEGEDVYVIVYE